MSPLNYEEVVDYGKALLDEAEQGGVTLRMLGSVAIRQHCQHCLYLFDKASRPITDLDLVAYSKDMKPLKKLIRDKGLIGDERMNSIYGDRRQIYDVPQIEGLHIDIFFDNLDFCHVVPFRGRLELDSPTITMTDAFLEKMQIVQINAKDLKDTIILLLEHGLKDAFDRESIDVGYLKKLLGGDWGFYHTVVQNLNKTVEFMKEEPFVEPDEMRMVEDRVARLLDEFKRAPKSLKWKMRARVGTSVQWYKDVDEVGG